ncbi:MAG: hypothetical protein DRP84_08500 [Spirochaetes bacterium]|nr:MAG: hypothetical protein DRP84_08500 [Spirochaetota bacterium]
MKFIFSRIKKLIHWYLKENSIIILPFILLSLFLWIVTSKIIYRSWRRKKNKRIIAFTGLYYNGNSRAVYDYIRKNRKYNRRYVCYWIARNRISLSDIKKEGGNVVYVFFPFSGIRYLLNTDAVVTNDSFLSILFPNKPKMIQLWHGVGPKGEKRDKIDYEEIDAWCVSSEYTKQRHIELWGAPPEKLFVTGFARMDTLLRYLKEESLREKFCREFSIPMNKKILLYAPTWETGIWPWEDPYKEFEKFCKFCNQNNVIILFRPHPLFKKNSGLSKMLKRYNNFLIIDVKKEREVMRLLAVADILVTDWSSLYTDYFLTEKPIIYFEVDRDYFCTPKGRGYGEIPPDYRAGEIVHNSREFYKALKTVLEKGNLFRRREKMLLKTIHGDIDGKISDRVSKVINNLLEQGDTFHFTENYFVL